MKLSPYQYALVAKYLVQNCGLRIRTVKAGYKVSLYRAPCSNTEGRSIHFPPKADKQSATKAAIDTLFEEEYIYFNADNSVALVPYFWLRGDTYSFA